MAYGIVLTENQYIIGRTSIMTATPHTCNRGPGILGKDILGDILDVDLEENFFRNLPVLMERFGYKQARLAKALGLHPSTVNLWLKRKQVPSYPIANRIATLFGLKDPSILFSNSLEPLAVFHSEAEAIEFLQRKMQERLNETARDKSEEE